MRRFQLFLSIVLLFCAISVFANVDYSAYGAYYVSHAPVFLKNSSDISFFQVESIHPISILNFQVTAYKWPSKADFAKQHYQPTNEVVISPPLFSIKGKGKQVVRIALLKPLNNAIEHVYMLHLQERGVEELNKVKQFVRRAKDHGVALLYAENFPVYVAPAHIKIQLTSKLKRLANNRLQLKLQNKGNVHVKLQNLQVFNQQGQSVKAFIVEHGQNLSLNRYETMMLAGAKDDLTLVLQDSRAGQHLQLKYDYYYHLGDQYPMKHASITL